MNWVVDVILNDALWTFFLVAFTVTMLAGILFFVVKQQLDTAKDSIENDLINKGWQAVQITIVWGNRFQLYRVKGINPEGQVETRECLLIGEKIYWQDSEEVSS